MIIVNEHSYNEIDFLELMALSFMHTFWKL